MQRWQPITTTSHILLPALTPQIKTEMGFLSLLTGDHKLTPFLYFKNLIRRRDFERWQHAVGYERMMLFSTSQSCSAKKAESCWRWPSKRGHEHPLLGNTVAQISWNWCWQRANTITLSHWYKQGRPSRVWNQHFHPDLCCTVDFTALWRPLQTRWSRRLKTHLPCNHAKTNFCRCTLYKAFCKSSVFCYIKKGIYFIQLRAYSAVRLLLWQRI